MRRLTVLVLAIVVATSILLITMREVMHSDAQEGALIASHPVVGAWIVRDSSGLWPTPEILVTFFSDGNAIATDGEGTTAQGTWRVTGVQTAELTLFGFGFGGPKDELATFFTQVEVAADGATWIRSSAISGGDLVRAERITPEIGG